MMAISEFNGNKLRLIRLFHGLSQEELGQLVTASRQYIQQLEVGAKLPAENLSLTLSEALSVYPDFFTTPLNINITEDQCHFRKQRTTPANLIRETISHGLLFYLVILDIDSKLTLPQINFINRNNFTLTDIESIAEDCRNHWGLGIDAPIKNMTRALENAGAVVTYFQNISNKLDALSIDAHRPIIVLSSDKEESAARIRFDLAHECGHLIMHSGIKTGDYKTEEEANRFASAFLLPRKAFIQEYPQSKRINWTALYEMKLRWKTSVRAIIKRAFDLRLIDSMQYRRANIYLNKTGQTKFEKYDDHIEKEEPELLKIAIEVLNKEFRITLYDMGAKLRIKPAALSKLLGISIAPPTDNNVINFESYKYIRG